MNIIAKLIENGFEQSLRKISFQIRKNAGIFDIKHRNTPKFADPTLLELEQIERSLVAAGVTVESLTPSVSNFDAFVEKRLFENNYHGGSRGGVWREKLLEHWLSAELLGLSDFEPNDIFVDIAAASSPWAKIQREQFDVQAYALDLAEIGSAYVDLPYYRIENATETSFADASVRGIALHCAFEMFLGDDDSRLVDEIARILAPGGRAVILPLYMHTHACAYSSPEYFGRSFPDAGAAEYVRLNAQGIPSSRKYDAATLRSRVLDVVERNGMTFSLSVLRNKNELGPGIYCHFILEINR